ncbi:MAG: DEAD/DEAH box helicase, partial [Terracoccus sp.]
VMSAGEVVWRGHGSLPGDDGWVSLHLADAAHLTLTPPETLDLTDAEDAVLDALAGGGAWFFRALATRVDRGEADVLEALWSLVWSGRITNDTAAPLRALLAGGRTAHKRTTTAPRSTRYSGRRGSLGRFGSLRGALAGTTPEQVGAAESKAEAVSLRAGRAAGSGPASGVGRWALLPTAESDPTVRAVTTAELLLDRYGVLTRGSVMSEDVPGGFAAVYRVLAAAEEAGKVRRGYFVEGLGASQFAPTGAVDRLRSMTRLPGAGSSSTDGRDGAPGGSGPDHQWLSPVARSGRDGDSRREASRLPALVLAASDPANPYGAALGWPERPATDATDPDDGPDVRAGSSDPGVGRSTARSGPTVPGGAAASGDGPAPRTSRRKGHQPGRKAGALVVLVDGELVLYVERGGKTMLCWSDDDEQLQAAADALALSVREGALGRLTVEKADGTSLLGSDHPLVQALSQAGFHMTPRGLRLRR